MTIAHSSFNLASENWLHFFQLFEEKCNMFIQRVIDNLCLRSILHISDNFVYCRHRKSAQSYKCAIKKCDSIRNILLYSFSSIVHSENCVSGIRLLWRRLHWRRLYWRRLYWRRLHWRRLYWREDSLAPALLAPDR